MDKIEINSVLVLEGKEYAVVYTYTEDNTTYLYLVNTDEITIENGLDVIFGKLNGDYVAVISDPDELEKVIKKVNEGVHSYEYLSMMDKLLSEK